jgi:transcription termination factor 2
LQLLLFIVCFFLITIDIFKDTQTRIVDLPEKKVEVIRFRLKAEEKSIYEKIFAESKETVKEFLANRQQRLIGKTTSTGSNKLTEILLYLLRLRQACCHMSLLEDALDKTELQNMKVEADGIESALEGMSIKDESSLSQSSSFENISAVKALKSNENLTGLLKKSYLSSKVEKAISMVDEIIDEYPEDKLIIVSQWTTMLGILARHLDRRDLEYCQISGDINLIKRNEIVQEFNNKSNTHLKVMLLSLTAGGVGLNLIGANRMFLMDIHWNPALEQQCSDRIYRVGQKKDVTIYRFLCENTIEERIEQIQKYKTDLAQKVCGDKGHNIAGMTSTATNAKLTLNDFKLLFTDFDNNKN